MSAEKEKRPDPRLTPADEYDAYLKREMIRQEIKRKRTRNQLFAFLVIDLAATTLAAGNHVGWWYLHGYVVWNSFAIVCACFAILIVLFWKGK